MLTFDQFVGSGNTQRLAKRAFTLMVQHGLDPVAFVDWYEREGQHLNEDFGPAVGGAIGSAVGAVANAPGQIWGGVKQGLHNIRRSLNKGGDDIQYSPGDQSYYHVPSNQLVPSDQQGKPIPQPHLDPANKQVVQDALQKLQDIQSKSWIHQSNPQLQAGLKAIIDTLMKVNGKPDTYGQQVGKAVPPGGQQPVDPMAAKMATASAPGLRNIAALPSSSPVGNSWYVPMGNTLSEHNEILIDMVVEKCIKKGIDPHDFYDWYATEGVRCHDRALFEGRFGDWLGAIGNGVGGYFKNTGFHKGYNAHYDKIKADTVGHVTLALKTLQQKIPNLGGTDFQKNMQTVIGELDKMTQLDQKEQPAPTEEPGAPGQQFAPATSQNYDPSQTAMSQPPQNPTGSVPDTVINKVRDAMAYPNDPQKQADPEVAEFLQDPTLKGQLDQINAMAPDSPEMQGKDADEVKHQMMAQKIRNYLDQKRGQHDWHRPLGNSTFMEYVRRRR